MSKPLIASLFCRLRGPVDPIKASTLLLTRLSFLCTRVGRFSLALILMAGVVYYFFSPVFRGYTLSDMSGSRNEIYPWAYQPNEQPESFCFDQAAQSYPYQVLLNGALKSNDFPLWDPYSFTGHPLFTNGQNLLLYLPRTLLSLVTTPTKAHDLLVVSHMLLVGLTMFLLLSGIRISFVASLFGGIAWMLNSFTFVWLPFESILAVAAGLPLALLLLRRTVRLRSLPTGIWLGIVMALMFFGGQVLFVEFAFAAIACYGAYLLFRRSRRASRSASRLGLIGIAGYGIVLAIPAVVAAGLIAIQLIPTWEMVQTLDRSAMTYSELLFSSLRASDLLFFFAPHRIESSQEAYMFLGTPTAILALIGFCRRHSLVVYSRVMGTVVLLLATGTPLVWVFYKLMPGFNHMRLHRLLFLFNFAAAVLAAFGLDWVLRRAPLLMRISLKGWWRFGWRAVVTSTLICIVIVQMHRSADSFNRYEIDRGAALFPTTPLIEAVGDREKVRILPIYPAFAGSSSTILRLQSVGGYESVVPERIGRFWRAVEDAATDSASDRSYITAEHPVFSIDSTFDLLPRVGVTDIIVPPPVPSLAPAVSGKWNIPDKKVLEKQGLSGGDLVALVGDWDGDGQDTAGLCDMRSNTFYLWKSQDPDEAPVIFQFGVVGKGRIPLAGDWNGDKVDTIGMYDPAAGEFHLRNSNIGGPADLVIRYGEPGKGWIPLAGDWDGDGVDTVGLYDPKESVFHLKNTLKADGNTETKFQFGSPNQGCIPITGDWDCDKVDTVGLYNPKDSVFLLENLNAAGPPDVTVPYGLANRNLKPVSGNWNKAISSGRFDVVGLFDPVAAEFYLSVPAFFGGMKADHVYSGADGNIFKVRNPVPRAYIVPAAEVVDSSKAAFLRFVDLGFDPTQAVIVESEELKRAAVDYPAETGVGTTGDTRVEGNNSGATGRQEKGSAEISSRSLNSMTVRVDSPGDGWLVVTESWDKGWSAKVDGKPAPVLPGNYVFRTMRIPVGEHKVELVYRPVGFVLGSAITCLTLGVLLIAAVVWLFKRRGKALDYLPSLQVRNRCSWPV